MHSSYKLNEMCLYRDSFSVIWLLGLANKCMPLHERSVFLTNQRVARPAALVGIAYSAYTHWTVFPELGEGKQHAA